MRQAPLQKPRGVSPSPFMVGGIAKGLWRGLAFIAPFTSSKMAGTSTLLNAHGQPIGNLVAGSTAQLRSSPYGPGVGISGASNILQQDNFAPIVTSNGIFTGDLTMVCFANPIAEARASMLLSQTHLGGFTAWCNINANAGNLAGRFRMETGAAGVDIVGVVDGNYHMFGGVRRGGVLSSFVDGVVRATQGTTQAVGAATSGIAIGQNAEASDYRTATTTNIVFAAAWNRALTNVEMRLLAADPFCMFRQRRNISKYYVAAAGGADVRNHIIPAYMRFAA